MPTKIRFDAEAHKYYLGDKELKGITTMLHEQGLAPCLDYVNEDILIQRATIGDMIHAEIHNYIVNGEEPITEEGINFKNWAEENNITFVASEKLVHNNDFAGTLDLMYIKNGELYISDIKTTSQAPSDYVSWQTGCYKALLPKKEQAKIKHHTCIWCRDSNFKEIPVQTKSDEDIQKLFECVLNGEQFSIALNDTRAITNLILMQETIEEMKKQQEELESKMLEFKNACMEEMKARGLKKFEFTNQENGKKLTLTYVAESKRTSFDSKRFKEENQSLYDQYLKESTISETLKVSVK